MLLTRYLERLKDPMRAFIATELAIICFAIALPVVFVAVPTYADDPAAFPYFKILFLAVSFTSGLLTGSQFPLANKLYLEKSESLSQTAGWLYAADLLGGWFGGIVGAVLLLPVLGLTGTCITVGLLKLTSFVFLATQRDQRQLATET